MKTVTSVFGIRPKARGFSLLELMLVLSLSAILMGIVATAITEGPVLRKAARDVLSSLQATRAAAIASQKETVWSIDIDSHRMRAQGTALNKSVHEGITIKLNTAESELLSDSAGGIRFFPDGSSSGGSIDLTHNEQTFTVNVEWISGRISLN